MRLYELVVALIRILALKLGFDALLLSLTLLSTASQHKYAYGTVLVDFILFAIAALLSWALWALSSFFARIITRGQNSSLATGNLTLLDLYSFAFVLIGLYFAVDSFGSCLTWFHYLVYQGSGSLVPRSPSDQTSFYTLFRYFIKCVLGLALTFNSRKWAAKLSAYQSKEPLPSN